jgi:hypothetical protein
MATETKKGVNKIAKALKCSPSYVSDVLNGVRDDKSPLAKKIKATHKMLVKAERQLMRELKQAKH